MFGVGEQLREGGWWMRKGERLQPARPNMRAECKAGEILESDTGSETGEFQVPCNVCFRMILGEREE